MKIQVASDLHLEFERQHKGKKDFIPFDLEHTDADVIVLAGDIGVGFKEESKFCERLAKDHGKPVIFVLGNHSFYGGGNVDRVRGQWANYKSDNVHYIDDGHHWSYKGVNFIGGILWTDFNNYNAWDMRIAEQMMNDYRGCRMTQMDSGANNMHAFEKDGMTESSDYYFTPRRSVDEHLKTKEYMDYMLRELEGTKVVVTHHLPSRRSGDIRYRDDSLNPAYYSNLDDWVRDKDIALWVHGHTHGSNDYDIGGTRVVCNPRGYFHHDENKHFNKGLVVEVESGNV